MKRAVILLWLALLTFAASAGAVVPDRSRVAVIGLSFASHCNFSHRAPDDPIVYPGHPGWSHDHTFVGNTSIGADSTLASLRSGWTTCQPTADTAAYWAPTLLNDGSPVEPLGATIYYLRLTFAPVRAFPPGLRMIAGNSSARRPQPYSVTYWQCGHAKTDFNYAEQLDRGQQTTYDGIPTCSPTSNLELVVKFPNCWNGRSLDSRTHKNHVTYSRGGRCPARYPVPIPALTLVYRYPPLLESPKLFLSSGGPFSGHADFINAWNQSALEKLVDTCLNERGHCEGDGRH